MLRPVLSLLYINDVTSEIQSQIHLFADDYLIYRTIYSEINDTILQNDLNSLDSWASKWQMEFNVSKCKVSKCTRSISLYSMKGMPLESVEEHSHLGVTLCNRTD